MDESHRLVMVQTGQNEMIPARSKQDRIALSEIYLDGKLKNAVEVGEDEKSYGIFMHSLILSNYTEVMKVNNRPVDVIGDEYEKAIYYYTVSKGFDKNLIETIAPKLTELNFDSRDKLKGSTHLINEKVRIISKGTPDELLKRCSYILRDSQFVKITRRIFREANSVMNDMIARCLNVYAIAIKDISRLGNSINYDMQANDMTLVALVGMGRA